MVAISEVPDETPATEAEANLGVREFKSEFDTASAVLDIGLSTEHRPDAISLDYHTCYTLGPVQIGDFSAGPIDRAWRVRCTGNVVYRARLNDDRTDFDPEQVLFQFAGVAPTEIDAAFDQAARILVCMERATGIEGQPELWIYYFDPFAADYILTKFGNGRTPRAVLDDVQDSSNADILVFYMNDNVGMCYRQQRDRYAVEYIVTGTVPVAVDTSGMTVVGPVTFSYPSPFDSISGYLGQQFASGINSTLRLAFSSGTPTVYPSTTKFAGALSGGGNPSNPADAGKGGAVEINFSTPVNFVEIEMNNSTFDGAVAVAYDANYKVLGRHIFTHTVGGVAQLAQLASAGIKYLYLAASATDVTTWDNLRYSTSPLPVVADDVWPPASNIFIEDVYRSTDHRVNILYSVHNPATGTYALKSKSTALYPFALDFESWQMRNTVPQASDVHKVFIYALPPGELDPVGNAPDGHTEYDLWQLLSVLPISGILINPISLIDHTLYDKDSWQMFTVVPQSGTVPVVLFFHTLYDIDNWQLFQATPQSGILVLVVIVHTLYDIDAWKLTTTPQSGILA
jgi:hypothetical protein